MILVDSSVWIDHLRRPDTGLMALLDEEEVLAHPFVIGELAMGSLADRAAVLASIERLVTAGVATHHEVLTLVDGHRLFGLGLSYVDAHLLASTLITPETALWTRDRRLHAAAARMGVAAEPTG